MRLVDYFSLFLLIIIQLKQEEVEEEAELAVGDLHIQ